MAPDKFLPRHGRFGSPARDATDEAFGNPASPVAQGVRRAAKFNPKEAEDEVNGGDALLTVDEFPSAPFIGVAADDDWLEAIALLGSRGCEGPDIAQKRFDLARLPLVGALVRFDPEAREVRSEERAERKRVWSADGWKLKTHKRITSHFPEFVKWFSSPSGCAGSWQRVVDF
jgi:hypothetical protein